MSSAREIRNSILGAALLGCFSLLFIFLLHPRLGIRDVDGYAYIIGARSLHRGAGYRSLMGEPLNHWPPGYSLLLSLFRDPITAALVLNYLSFGATVGLLYYLLRRVGWSWQAGLGASVALGSGFFRLLANEAHADIMSYALFFVAVCLIIRSGKRTWPSLIWALLVPIKLIAVVFLPPAIVADGLDAGRDWKRLLSSYAIPATLTALAVGSILIFNLMTTGSLIPSSHESSSLHLLSQGARSFVASIPRTFLFDWHGPVREPFPRLAFAACITLCFICLLSLRPTKGARWFRFYGAGFLICSAVLLCVRSFDPSARLVGYGLIMLMLGFTPRAWANGAWLLYGVASVATAVVNARTVNSLGINDPRYAALAAEFRMKYKDSTLVATNSFHILDIHTDIPSVPISNYSELMPYRRFFWVTLPQYDAVTTAVTPMPHPGHEWREETRLSGGVLFVRCE